MRLILCSYSDIYMNVSPILQSEAPICFYFFTSKVANGSLNVHTTHKHNTHNTQQPNSFYINRAVVPLTPCAAPCYSLMQGVCRRVWRRCGWFACLGHQPPMQAPSKYIEKGGALTLGGRHSFRIPNNHL